MKSIDTFSSEEVFKCLTIQYLLTVASLGNNYSPVNYTRVGKIQTKLIQESCARDQRRHVTPGTLVIFVVTLIRQTV